MAAKCPPRVRRVSRETPIGRVVFTPSGGWWVVELPAVHGAYSQGRTRRSAYRNLLDAVIGLAKAHVTSLDRASSSYFAGPSEAAAFMRWLRSGKVTKAGKKPRGAELRRTVRRERMVARAGIKA